MAAASGAFGSKCGYNQSSGGYYVLVTAMADVAPMKQVVEAGSGGAATTTVSQYPFTNDGAWSTNMIAIGATYKDMGKTVVDPVSGVTYRKFQYVAPLTNNAATNTFGVTGAPAVGANTGYATVYLAVTHEGTAGTPVRLARLY